MSHTRGDWKVALFKSKEQNHEVWVQTHEGFKVIADVCRANHSEKEALANAQLIVASPRLLMTLEEVHTELTFLGKKQLINKLGIKHALELAKGLRNE